MYRPNKRGSGEYEMPAEVSTDDRLYLVRSEPRRWSVATVACVLAMADDRCDTIDEWRLLLDEVDEKVRPLTERLDA